MRKRNLGFEGLIILTTVFISIMGVTAQQRRTTQRTPPANDLKIKYKTTTSGQSSENTTMIKGARERSEMRMGQGMDMINIMQCDLKRTVQIGDNTRKYIINKMDADASSDAGVSSSPPGVGQPSRRGGVVTYVTTATDTGERKEMFGFTARHVKTSLVINSSPDACTPVNQKMETDGWYIDLSFGIDCDLGRSRMMARPPVSPSGCQDRVQFRREGSARTGYPLVETMTMYGPDGKAVFTTTKEVLELSREPLDAALFDIPAGYTEASSMQELWGMPSASGMMGGSTDQPQATQTNNDGSNLLDAKAPGTVRVGVVAINNRTDRPISTDGLRVRLIGNIESNGIDAIALNAVTPTEAEVEAKAKQCDFILYTDISALKTSAAKKIGGMFGRAAGVGGIDKTEAKVEFKLFALSEMSQVLQSTASAKEEGDEASVGTAIDQEARMVAAEAQRRKRS